MKLKRMALIVSIINLLCINWVYSSSRVCKEINVDMFKVKKNMINSYVGYDCEDFACGANFKWILTKGRAEFSRKCHEAGVKVWRFAEMSRYSWRGELPTRLMLARKVQHHYKGSKEIYKRYAARELNWWFEPKSFWSFCRENNILVIPMINAVSYYNPTKKMAFCLVNSPSHYVAAADEAAAYVKWLKDNDYLDLAKVWEIGNESFICGWEPKQYASFLKILIPKLRAVQPDIKLAVPVGITTRDNPDMKEILRRMRAGKPANEKDEWAVYEQVMRWSGQVIEALGDDAKYISHGILHSYGAEPLYNSNIKGLETTAKLLRAFQQSRSWRLLNTEWRDRSGEDGACHRNFKIAALWKAKFVMLMMAFQRMDYTCAHSLFGFSGGLYWSDGNWWALQSVNRSRRYRTRLFDNNGDGKPRFDVGAFGPVAKMCNDLIASYPLLLGHGAELGNMSSGLYYNQIYFGKKKAVDLQWLVSTSSKRDMIAAIVVNTEDRVRNIKFRTLQGKFDMRAAQITSLTSKPGFLDVLQIPGYERNWQLQTSGAFRDDELSLQPQSVSLITVPVEINASYKKYVNLVKSQLPRSIRGFSVSNGCKLELRNGTVTIVAGEKGSRSACLNIPCNYVKPASEKRRFRFTGKIRSNLEKVKCVPLVIGAKWAKIAAIEITADKTWKQFELNFELPAAQPLKMLRVNIYGLPSQAAVMLKEIVMEQDK